MSDDFPILDFPPDIEPGMPDLPPEGPAGEVQGAQEPRVRDADEILDPEALIPAGAIVARLEGITAADVARSVVLAERAFRVTRISSEEEMQAVDTLRDELQAHQALIEGRLGPYVTLAHRLHKSLTGLRATALDRVPAAVQWAGSKLAMWVREQQEAEAKRQREARAAALAAEQERLRLEAEAAEQERLRLEEAALSAPTREEAAALEDQAAQLQQEVDQARLEAATTTAPPIAAQPIAVPEAASTRDNWQALPAHAESWDDMPIGDLRALVLAVAARCSQGDDSLLHLLTPNKTACNQLAKALKQTLSVAGIRAVNPPVYSKRRRG